MRTVQVEEKNRLLYVCDVCARACVEGVIYLSRSTFFFLLLLVKRFLNSWKKSSLFFKNRT